MIKKALTTIGLILLLTQVAFSANQYKTPPNNIDDWDNKFLVLLADDSDAKKSRKVIEKTIAKDYLKMPLGVFKQHQPISAATFITMGQLFSSTKNKRADEESAREKLGRYLVIGFPDGVDLEAIFDAMKNNPDIAYVSVMDKRETHVNIKTDNRQDLMTQDQGPPDITEDRFWGFNKMKAAQAHNYVKGHSYIGVADLGISTNHPDLIDYSGNTWKGGNFHPGLSFRVGAVNEAGSQANPYSGAIAFGQVDEYNQFRMPGDLTCNGSVTGPTTEIAYVGHGSHVAGIIAANGDNGLGVVGVCKNCPLSIAQHNRPTVFDTVNNPCLLLFDPLTHPDMSNIEARTSQTLTSVYASIGFLIDAGVEVVNYSGGYFLLDSDLFVEEGIAINLVSSAFCTQNPNDSACLVLEYAQDREVVIVASAGNYAVDQLDFPANDPRVFGVSGLQNTSGGAFWAGTTFSANATANDFYGGTAFGSSFGTNSTNGPTFSAPARDIYSTMYAGKQYIYGTANGCDDRTDGVPNDGYGYCTGTSMAAPMISGVVGLVRSVNPLLSVSTVRSVLKGSTGQWTYNNQLGWGTPKANVAVKSVLGVSAGNLVLNRVTPLFSMYGAAAGDIAQTTKPQVAMAYNLNTILGYTPFTAETVVSGFIFSESPNNPGSPAPRADIFILSTHATPPTGRATIPLYRQHKYGPYGGNPNNADWVLVLASELSGSSSFKSIGYNMDGLAGYIYSLCSPEPTCIPPGAVAIYRAYNSPRDDHAVFTAAKVSYMQSIGYVTNLTKLGYAYPNLDTDSDGIIDGMEYILGTDPLVVDSDCDGQSDGFEYPMTRQPRSDPMDGSCGGGGLEQTPWGSNSGSASGTNRLWNYTLGYHFTPSVNGSVTSLGGYFNGNKTVRLYNRNTGVTLATTTVNSNNSWAYSSITPVALVAGQAYTVAAVIGGNGGSFKYLNMPKTYGDITIHASTFLSGNGRPTNSTTSVMYGQVDITFMPD